MVAIPEEIIGMTEYDEDDNWVLKKGATEEQRKIFEKFKKDLESGELSDVEVKYEE